MPSRNHHTPPLWATRFLRWYCSHYYFDEIEGDLREAYAYRIKKLGAKRASILYIWDVIRFFRPYVIRGNHHHRLFGASRSGLFANYIKSSYRNLMRHKVYALINVIGLSIGIASCLLIGLYLNHELSYDRFFADYQNIYRVVVHQESNGTTNDYAVTHTMLAPLLKENFPEIESSARIHRLYFHPEVNVVLEDRSFVETKMFLADNSFFDLFQLKFKEGDPSRALSTKNQVVITDRTASKYFGEEPALGKTIKLDFGRKLTVSGVIEDLPENSHFDFDLVASLEFMIYIRDSMLEPDWTVYQVCTYLKFKEGTDPVSFEAKLPGFIQAYGQKQIKNRLGMGSVYELSLQPLRSIHLHSKLDAEMKANGDINHIYFLSVLAAFILIICCINFINLSTARSTERAKEIGIRRVLGSNRINLIHQFLIESVLVSMLSLVVALVIAGSLLPTFNQLVSRDFTFSLFLQPALIPSLLVFSIVIGVIAGSYPALIISALKPSRVLKGRFKSTDKGIILRNALVLLQFLISISLIAATLVIDEQMKFVSSKRLGFNKEQIVLLKHPLSLGQHDNIEQGHHIRMSLAVIDHSVHKIETFKKELKNIEGIQQVGGVFQQIGQRFSFNRFHTNDPEELSFNSNIQMMDHDFIETMGIEILMGRDFSTDFNEQQSIIINQAMMKLLGWANPLGKKLRSEDGNIFQIIGVAKDYHYQSLHERIRPLIIVNGMGNPHYFPTSLAIRLNTEDLSGIISQIEDKWKEFVPAETINLSFLDQELSKMYESEETSKRVIKVFASLALTLACIGLVGIATYVAQQRAKEICIRKILGAQLVSILALLFKSFATIIFLAFLIAVPITYLVVDQWLEDFAYHISIDALPFLYSLIFTSLIAFASTSYHSVKIALIDPIKNLRNE